jgi:hypothetical protein
MAIANYHESRLADWGIVRVGEGDNWYPIDEKTPLAPNGKAVSERVVMWHIAMASRYRIAAHQPWWFFPPDPPEPE